MALLRFIGNAVFFLTMWGGVAIMLVMIGGRLLGGY